MSNSWHEIDFSVPLSNSRLFDLHTGYMVNQLCEKFPGLRSETDQGNNCIHIYGQLDDYWYEKFNKAVFQLGTLDID